MNARKKHTTAQLSQGVKTKMAVMNVSVKVVIERRRMELVQVMF